jgi:hypothetical protein
MTDGRFLPADQLDVKSSDLELAGAMKSRTGLSELLDARIASFQYSGQVCYVPCPYAARENINVQNTRVHPQYHYIVDA